MNLVRILRSFDGESRMAQYLDRDGRPELAGDFNGDGLVDLGGPTVHYVTWGQSLGGILSSILAGIDPAITAAAPSSPGGGLTDIPLRSTLAPVSAGAVLRTLGPILVGEPVASGLVDISTVIASANRREKRLLAKAVPVMDGDRVVLENLVNGKRNEVIVGREGRFRIHIAADALSGPTKKALYKLPDVVRFDEPRPAVVDTKTIGDTLVLRVFEGRTGTLTKTLDTFEEEIVFEGLTYRKNSPLVALSAGWGLQRNTPEFRKFMAIAQTMLEPADPINYAPHLRLDPLPSLDYDKAEPGTNIVFIVTAGDTVVPVSTGIALARAAGIVDYMNVDPRYGKTQNQVLIDHYVTEGLAVQLRFGNRIVMDPENLSASTHAPNAPRLDPPLRLTVQSGHGIGAMRLPLLDPRGQHAFAIPEPDSAFDNNTFLVHMVGRFFSTKGRELRDDPCMATESCSWIPPASSRAIEPRAGSNP
jgi:hypothetical protein